MKLFAIILLALLTACGQVDYSDNNAVTSQKKIEVNNRHNTYQDSLKFPDWLIQLYPTELKLEYQVIRQELTLFKTINDSVTYCIYKEMDGICERNFLATHIYRKPKNKMEIGHNCDHDLSVPYYTWKEFNIKASNIILTTEYRESVHDSLIDENGRVKQEYDFLEMQTTTDTTRQVFQVNQRGQIIEIKK